LKKNLFTIKESLLWAEKELGGVTDDPRHESMWLLMHVLGLEMHGLILQSKRQLTKNEEDRFRGFIKRRRSHEPCQHITGRAYFMDMELIVTRDTLIPRPETEILASEAINALRGRRKPIAIDLCTGTGCIAISIAREIKGLNTYGLDNSKEALKVAEQNAVMQGVKERITFLKGDLFAPLRSANLKGMVSLIASNPPYVSKGDLKDLPPEIRDHEPRQALYAGPDGLAFFRRIIPEAIFYLKKGGYLLLEVGYNQADEVKGIADDTKAYKDIEFIKDYSGIKRVFKARPR
jgi:release factor glutamine methyltransferase